MAAKYKPKNWGTGVGAEQYVEAGAGVRNPLLETRKMYMEAMVKLSSVVFWKIENMIKDSVMNLLI